MPRHTFPREFYVPKDAQPVADPLSDAVAYVYRRGSKPCVALFSGKAAKPAQHFSCRDVSAVERAVQQFFLGRRNGLEHKAQAKVEARASADTFAASIEVGDIFHYSFGYDETHHCFVQITSVKGKHIKVRPIAQAQEDLGYDWRHRCMPQSDNFTGPETTHVAQAGYLRIGYHHASKWNTHTVAGVKMGPAYTGGGCH